MIRVRYLHPSFGDKPKEMTAPQLQTFLEENQKEVGIIRFDQDDQAYTMDLMKRTGIWDQLDKLEQNGQAVTVYPKVGGG